MQLVNSSTLWTKKEFQKLPMSPGVWFKYYGLDTTEGEVYEGVISQNCVTAATLTSLVFDFKLLSDMLLENPNIKGVTAWTSIGNGTILTVNMQGRMDIICSTDEQYGLLKTVFDQIWSGEEEEHVAFG